MDYDDGLNTGQKEEKMKRRLTLPSSALLGGNQPEEDPKKRERGEELDFEEGLASIASNHSTGSIFKIKTWIFEGERMDVHILKILHREEKEES